VWRAANHDAAGILKSTSLQELPQLRNTAGSVPLSGMPPCGRDDDLRPGRVDDALKLGDVAQVDVAVTSSVERVPCHRCPFWRLPPLERIQDAVEVKEDNFGHFNKASMVRLKR